MAFAPVAQLVEHLTFNQGVRSSILRRSTKGLKFQSLFFSGCSAVGSARALGARCRRFESCHSDQKKDAELETILRLFSTKSACVGINPLRG